MIGDLGKLSIFCFLVGGGIILFKCGGKSANLGFDERFLINVIFCLVLG